MCQILIKLYMGNQAWWIDEVKCAYIVHVQYASISSTKIAYNCIHFLLNTRSLRASGKVAYIKCRFTVKPDIKAFYVNAVVVDPQLLQHMKKEKFETRINTSSPLWEI